MKGQALVEFALTAPALLLLIFGGIEAIIATTEWAAQGRATGALADWIAADTTRPASEAYGPFLAAVGLADCTVTTDVDEALGIVTAATVCTHTVIVAHGIFDGLPMSAEAVAVLAEEEATP